MDNVIVEGKIKIPYRWPAGRAGGRFLALLRDEGRLVGLRCPKCRRVSVPPKSRCLTCRVSGEEWVPVGPAGEVTTWTVSGDRVFALVRLDGADTALLHILLDVKAPRTGMRVTAVLAEKRTGEITDLKGFRCVP